MTSDASARTIVRWSWKQTLTVLYTLESPLNIENVGHEVLHHRGEGESNLIELPGSLKCCCALPAHYLTAHSGPSKCRF